MKIHFIGICGKLNAGLAISLKNLGHQVSGSDKAFYPPMSEVLEKGNLKIMVGYKSNHIDEILPDLVAVGAAINDNNPEVIRAKELSLKIITPTELIEQFVIKDNSIVISGNYGKTTITGLLVHIFRILGIDPSYLIGGVVKNLESVVINDSKWSIVEGDEYPASKDGISKFFYYHPKYLVITNVSWDHTDVFKTEKAYRDNFIEIIKKIDKNGVVILNANDENLSNDSEFHNLSPEIGVRCKVLFSKRENNSLFFRGKKVDTNLFGKHNYDNIALAISVLEVCFDSTFLDSNSDKIIEAIESFEGISRRLEIKYLDSKVKIIDDFAHNPEKFKASIKAVSEEFLQNKIVVVFEPNMGNRTKISFEQYKDVFTNKKISQIFIPRWRNSLLKEDSIYMGEEEFASGINNFLNSTIASAFLDDEELVLKLLSIIKESEEPISILFMGSEPFRGIISGVESGISKI